eukprot:Nk52_evm36s210 gene=Nk52_evmTU36s210
MTAKESEGMLKCVICIGGSAKYTCPGCARRTCSLDCVRAHKAQYGCSGKRDRTCYVSIADGSYTERNFFSDYVLLEEAARASENASRERRGGVIKRARLGGGGAVGNSHQSAKVKFLIRGCKKRGIEYKVLPSGMQRHRGNTSYYHGKEDVLYWQCVLQFARINGCNGMGNGIVLEEADKDKGRVVGGEKTSDPLFDEEFRFTVAKFADNVCLEKLLMQFCVPNEDHSNAVVRHRLRPYNIENIRKRKNVQGLEGSAGEDGVEEKKILSVAMRELAVFLEMECREDVNEPLFEQMDLAKTLAEALKGKRILEQPVLHVCFAENASTFLKMLIERKQKKVTKKVVIDSESSESESDSMRDSSSESEESGDSDSSGESDDNNVGANENGTDQEMSGSNDNSADNGIANGFSTPSTI